MKSNLECNPLEVFHYDWALVTAGDEKSWNTMTISWGGMGTLWNKPVCTVYVGPVRYTHSFMEKSEYFTVSFYGEEYKKALGILGTKSGRDCDKVAEAGLTPFFTENAVTFAEADVTLVCKKIYRQDMDVSAMPDYAVENYYTDEAPHTMYIGEVVKIIRK